MTLKGVQGSSKPTSRAQLMADLENTYQEDNMATFVPAKMLLYMHEIVIKTCNLCHKLVELVVGFETSLGLKQTNKSSSTYG